MRVQVIGLGNIGTAVALYVSKFFDVIGYDINPKAEERASKYIKVAPSVEKADVYVIAVSTGLNFDGTPNMAAVRETACKISELQPDALVAVESTVAVGTTRAVASEAGLKFVVVCPHRWWKEDPLNYGVNQVRVIGALNSESMLRGKAFYQALGVRLHPVSSLELAEAAKIAENAYRFVEIAFAEELRIIAELNGLNFEELREACNTKWNVKILEARDGIGGECLPKDTRYLLHLYPDAQLLKGAIKADELYRESIKKLVFA